MWHDGTEGENRLDFGGVAYEKQTTKTNNNKGRIGLRN